MISAVSALSLFAFARQEKVIKIFSNGNVVSEFNASDVDYIQIDDLVGAPAEVGASVSGTSITINWAAVEGATYSIFRSPDNVNFTLLAKDLKTTTYTDNSPLRGSNYYRVTATVDGIESGYTTSVAATLPDNGMESGIYLGIYGFNRSVYEYPVLRLDETSISGFNGFIDGLSMQNGTLLYYSVEQALDAMQSTQYPSDLSNVALVTFTDGLDQGSMMKNDKYEDDTEYLDALNKRIKTQTVAGQNISAYSIGVRGSDVADIQKFNENLQKLASTPENATEVTSMAEVNAKFQEIAEQLSQSNYVQTINLEMPGVSNGTLVRFTFDNVNAGEKSNLYIEGTFNLKNKSLDNITYVGLKSTSGTSVKGTVNDIFVNFTFEGVHTDDNVLIKSEFTDEWTFITSNSSWQINSEFNKKENSEIQTERSSAAIMLVLDCSSSLADQFATAQSNAKGFIKTLYEASGMSLDPEDPETPNKSETTIYSTTPKDLSVAIWKDNTRYFLTPEQYQNANLKDATVEGLTVLARTGNFIISPYILNSNSVYKDYAMQYYADVLPDKDQATVISARYQDINSTLSSLGWSKFTLSDGWGSYYYLTKTAADSSSNYVIFLHDNNPGGNLRSNSSGYIRGITALNDSPIQWKDVRNLTLAVKKDNVRYFITDNDDLSQYDEIEGLAIFIGDQKFIIKLHDEQYGSVTKDTAMALYEDVLPTKEQAEVISMMYQDINSKLDYFGGNKFTLSDGWGSYYYLTKTAAGSSSNYVIFLHDNNPGGNLRSNSSGYIRGVITIDD